MSDPQAPLPTLARHRGPSRDLRPAVMGYGAAVLLALVTLGVASYGLSVAAEGARVDLRNEFRAHLRDAAAIAALHVDGDLHAQVVTAMADGSIANNTSGYLSLLGALKEVLVINPEFLFVYTMVPTDDPNQVLIVADAEDDPSAPVLEAEPYDASDYPELHQGFTEPSADTEIVCDEFGACMSGYAPIRDSSGQVVALLGVDTSAGTVRSHLEAVQRSLDRALLQVAALTAVVGAIMAYFVHRSLRAEAGRRQAQAQLQQSYEEMVALSAHLSAQAQKVRAGDLEGVQVDLRSDVPEMRELLGSFRFLTAAISMLAPPADPPAKEEEPPKGPGPSG